MVVTAKQLRLQTSRVLKKVQQVGSLTVTLRGKPVARLLSLSGKGEGKDLLQYGAIGMWGDRKDMKDPAAWVRKIRRARYSLR
jgi:prevent-host-death family protein